MLARKSILVVEDEPIVALSIKHTLVQWKFDATVGRTGEDALLTVGRDRPDLVLMDVKLKGVMDGVDTAVRLSDRGGVPVIFLTAYADPEMVARFAHVSCYSGYLTKPFEDAELKAMIFAILEKKKSGS